MKDAAFRVLFFAIFVIFQQMQKNMKKILVLMAMMAAVISCQKPIDNPEKPDNPVDPVQVDCDPNLAYQLLVYSFCDSNGDGIGDFNGITSRLDYLKDMGVSGIWLSPIHPASSYHGYDVLDYEAVNKEYGTEADFRNLVDQAHAKGISIYLDFVLNHTSKDHPWFLEAKKGPSSEYYDWYVLSSDPQADIKAGRIPMIATEGASGYDSGQWFTAVTGAAGAQKLKFTLDWNKKTLLAQQVSEVKNTGTQNSGKYLYYGDGKIAEFYSTGSNVFTLSLDFESSWGLLIRTSTTSWDNGTKWGAPSGSNSLSWDKPLTLSSSDAQDILVPGMSSLMYHSHFWTSYFADLNYGSAATCEQSGPFKAVTKAADKWIQMGVDGLRLDAVKHIYHNASSDENPTFLKKFYDHCNATYKGRGGQGEFYMVCEVFDSYQVAAPYYKGTPACFEFSWYWTLKDRINAGSGSDFVAEVQKYRKEYKKHRSDFIGAPKLSNHDEDRVGSDLGRNLDKMKLAGAVLLTSPGKPFVYQGEELGYWGTKAGGDEYVRTPIMWNASGSVADKKLGGKVDRSMLNAAISVESQTADKNSILNVYRSFGDLRRHYPALAQGEIGYVSVSVPSVSAWTMSTSDQKVLVVHNFGSGTVNVTLSGMNLTRNLAANGSVSANGTKLTLGGYSSAVYLQ